MKRKSGFTRVVTTALTAAILVTGVFTGTATKVFASTTGVVDTNLLNLRSGASTSTPVLALLKKGAQLEITATEGLWYKVTVTVNGSSKSGYVHSSYVAVGDDAVGDDSDAATEVTGYGVVNTKALNVRNAASYSGSVIGVVGTGTKVEILALDGEWYKVNITLNGSVKTAYVHKSYITLTDNDSTADDDSTSADSADNTDTSVIAKGTVNTSYGLNLRSKASTSAGILGVLYNRTTVEILSESDGWYKVKVTLNGKEVTGYVYAQYIVKSDASSSDDSQTNSDTSSDNSQSDNYTKGIVKAALNLRVSPNTSCTVITVLRVGAVVDIESESNGWYKVTTTANGKEVSGYVSAQYVRKVSDQEAESGVIEVNATEEDEYLLACIIHVEATNQCYEGQLAVANVVLNRVKSPKWPDTIYDVIYQKGQFTPAYNGRLAKALAEGPSENAKKAAADALAGINNVEGYYFFNANGGINLSTVGGYKIIQDHTFYYY